MTQKKKSRSTKLRPKKSEQDKVAYEKNQLG